MNAMTSLQYRVRRGVQSDAKAVRDIFLAALREYGFAVEDHPNREIVSFGTGNDPARDDFVVVSGRKVCGFLILRRQSQTCGEVSKVFVARSQRGRGNGTMLFERAVEAGKERGYRELILESNTAFREGRRYYEKHGWVLAPHWPESISETRVYSMRLARG